MRRRRRLRWKLVLALVVGVAAVTGAAVAVQKVRSQRAALAFKSQAFDAAEHGDTEQAAKFIQLYVRKFRDDSGSVRELALLLEKTAKRPGDQIQVLGLFELALVLKPDDAETRRLAVKKALELRKFGAAKGHLQILAKSFPDDASIVRRLGECAEGSGNIEEASKLYSRAIASDAKQVESYVRLAHLLRTRLDQPEKADELMNRLRQANPDSATALIARTRYLRETGRPAEARADVERAVSLAGDSADIRYEAARCELALGHPEAADAHLSAGLKNHADHLPSIRLLAELRKRNPKTSDGQDIRALVLRTLKTLEENPRRTADILDLLIDVDELAEAKKLLAGPKNNWLPDFARDFLEARIKMAENDFVRARELLERCRAQLAPVQSLARVNYLLLGICQRRLGNPDQAAASFRTALDLSPAWAPAQLELAAAELKRGQFDEALNLYRKLMPEVPEARVLVVRLTMQRILKQPADHRDWRRVEELLADAPEAQKRSSDWRLLHSEVQLAQGNETKAREELESAIRAEPKEISYRLALVDWSCRKNDLARAGEILDTARKIAGDRVEIRLAQANLAVRRPNAEAIAELTTLAKSCDRFPVRERIKLVEGLYRLSAAVDIKLARQFGSQLAELEPGRIDLRFGLLRLALADNDESAARTLVAKLHELEGESGKFWRCGDVAAKLQFEPADSKSWIDAARQHASEAARARPDWSLPVLLLAELDERAGKIDSALVHFRSAIELGERSPGVVRHAVQLLQSRRRFEEAQELLRKLAGKLSLDAELAKLAIPALVGHETPEQILARARAAMPESSRDYRDHLWRGQLLASLGKNPADAEKSFRRAVELAPQAGEAWVGLVLFLASSNQKAPAAKVLAEAEQELTSPESAAALAICLEALGEIERAEKRLVDAAAKRPDDATIQRGLAALYLHAGKLKQVEPILDKLSRGPSSESGWARRQQAMILVQTGTYAKMRDAIPLIEQNLNSSRPTPEDERAKAILLALQPFRRAESIRALEASFKLLPSTADEKVLLAKLQEAAGNWPAARELLLAASTDKPAARHLIYFVNRLLVHSDLASAAQWVERLEKLDPDSLSTAAVKARVLVRLGKRDEANSLLRTLMLAASDPKQLIVIGRLMEENELYDSAEQAYRRYALRLKPKFGASADLPLARLFALRGRIDDALKITESVNDCRPDAIYSVASAILQDGKINKNQSDRLESWIKAAQKKSPDAASLNLALAGVYEQRLRAVEALAYYDRALDSDPNNISALNNSAMLLALTDHGKDALPRIERAIDLVGPLPPLLDTRAMAQLAIGNSAAAIADLHEAIAEDESAVRRFHLGLAYKAAGNEEEFARNVQRAKELKLIKSQLNPFERDRWREVR